MANTTNIGFKHISGDMLRKKHMNNDDGIELGALYLVFTDPHEDLYLNDYSKANTDLINESGLKIISADPVKVKGGQIWVKKSLPVDKSKYENANDSQWFLCASGVSNSSSVNPEVIQQTLAVVIDGADHILYLTNKQ